MGIDPGPLKSLVAVETAVPAEVVIPAWFAVSSAPSAPIVLDRSVLADLVPPERHVAGVQSLGELAAHVVNHASARVLGVIVRTDGDAP